VFEGATNYTCLLMLMKAGCKDFEFVKVDDLDKWRKNGEGKRGRIPACAGDMSEWNFSVGKEAILFDRLRALPVKLENVTSRIFQGIKTSADKIYIVDEIERQAKRVKVHSHEKNADYWLETDLLHPLVKGGDSKPYCLARTGRLILFPYVRERDGSSALISEKAFKTLYPLTWAYLVANKSYLEGREGGNLHVANWFAYGRSQALDVMPLPKIFTPDIAAQASFSIDLVGDAFFTGGVAGGYGILVLPEHSWQYILGLLNSNLLEWYIRQSSTQMRGGYYSYESRFIRHLPIRTVDVSDHADSARQKQVVALVDSMLSLHKQRATAKSAAQRGMVQRQIDATGAEIDRLVYDLYGLTAEEIALVEESTSEPETATPAA
jgi:hypothetical protein